jgi:hypothetical protein
LLRGLAGSSTAKIQQVFGLPKKIKEIFKKINFIICASTSLHLNIYYARAKENNLQSNLIKNLKINLYKAEKSGLLGREIQ